jgi:hypothetical protein
LVELEVEYSKVPQMREAGDLCDHVVAEVEGTQTDKGFEVVDMVDFEVAGGGEVELFYGLWVFVVVC